MGRIFKNVKKKYEVYAFWYNASITTKKGKLLAGMLPEFEDIYSFKNLLFIPIVDSLMVAMRAFYVLVIP